MSDHATQETSAPQTPPLDLSFVRTARNTSSVALALALVALFVTGLLYINMPKMITEETSGLASATEALKGRVSSMEGQVAELEELKDLPEVVRRQVLLDQVRELSTRSQALSQRVETPAQQEKLQQVNAILGELAKSYQD